MLYYYPEDFPEEAINDCSGQGHVDSNVMYWVDELNFNPPPEATRNCLRAYGAWSEWELSFPLSNARRLFWIMCCDFAEGARMFAVE